MIVRLRGAKTLNGKYYLIKKIGTKYKFYWAPASPWPEKDFEDWGVAVIDLSWVTEDPRPKHLRAAPLGYKLKPRYQVLRDPKIDGVRSDEHRYMVLGSGHVYHCLHSMDNRHRFAHWMSG